uniref:Uncharacterized protein n=1 Tax=Myoviridae sp. ctWb16 TaxID=2827690 RepID=A0A8S5T170_9CAUD|nr:MAG TPA: hypothetical protein [Myoviridae sp. ctWb16]DAV17851.1 MAG TPA: hypothetical protein [Caudoviricetes sp.]
MITYYFIVYVTALGKVRSTVSYCFCLSVITTYLRKFLLAFWMVAPIIRVLDLCM